MVYETLIDIKKENKNDKLKPDKIKVKMREETNKNAEENGTS